MNHITGKDRYARWYCINYRKKTYKAKRIFADSPTHAFKKFLDQYGHEAPSRKRIDYIIL